MFEARKTMELRRRLQSPRSMDGRRGSDMAHLSAPGDIDRRDFGRVSIEAQITDTGTFTISVYQGSYRVEELCSAHADRAAARPRYKRIAELARHGLSPEQIFEVIRGDEQRVLSAVAEILGDQQDPFSELSADIHLDELSQLAAQMDVVKSYIERVMRRSYDVCREAGGDEVDTALAVNGTYHVLRNALESVTFELTDTESEVEAP